MAQRIQIAIDCVDPDRLAAFWAPELGYEQMAPPDGYASWAEHNRAQAEEPDEAWIKVADPDGRGPTLLFHRVPEAKIVKNRVHLDVKASNEPPGDRQHQVDVFIEKIVALGGSRIRDVSDDAGFFAVMEDPEGNEFCVA